MEHLGAEEENLVSLGMDNDAQITGVSTHLSDVIDVIQMDAERTVNTTSNTMDVGGVDRRRTSVETAYIKILEQPASKALRFRYECEGRSAGSIPGVSSTPENKTYPTIQVVGYKGRAAVVVSCVTKDAPYRPHPHNLVGKEGCKKGICSLHVSSNNMIVSFSNLGIQCVKKKDIEEALRQREEIRIDPFRTGYAHRNHPTGIDLNAVRLCFQVFLEGPEPNTYTRALTPVVSDPIYDKKAMSDLVICNISDSSATVAGGREMILLCEKVAKEDIQIRYYEERDGQVVWEALADFQPTHVHKQVAISFRTPRYRTLEVDGPVKVFIQLKRPSDGATSEPRPFDLIPLEDPVAIKRKRQKYGDDSSSTMLRHFQESDKSRHPYTLSPSPDSNPTPLHSIKKEPTDTSPGGYYVGNPSPMYAASGHSPHPTPTHSPLLPVGRTPSPFSMMPQYGYGQPVYTTAGPSVVVGPSPTNIPIRVPNSLFAGGSCTTAPSYSPVQSSQPEMMRPGSAGMAVGIPGPSVLSPGVLPAMPTVQPPYNMVPLNNLSMAMSPGHISPVNYGGNATACSMPPPSNTINGGLQDYQGVEPAPPGPGANLVDMDGPFGGQLAQLNSNDLCQLGPWDSSNIAEQISSNLTLSESGPSSSCKREAGNGDGAWLPTQN